MTARTSRGIYRFLNEAEPADDAGAEAVYEADSALQALRGVNPAALRRLTIAAGYISGRLRVAINDTATFEASEFFSNLFGDAFIQKEGAHAEDALYLTAEQEAAATGQAPADVLEAIGVSRVSGLCSDCQGLFSSRAVPVYVPGELVRHDPVP